MYMKPDTAYKVTKGNTDGSINVDDIVYVDKGGWFYCSTTME